MNEHHHLTALGAFIFNLFLGVGLKEFDWRGYALDRGGPLGLLRLAAVDLRLSGARLELEDVESGYDPTPAIAA